MRPTTYAQKIHQIQLAKGYWKQHDFHLQQLLIIHELTSLLEAYRKAAGMRKGDYVLFDKRIESSNSGFLDAYKEAIRYSIEDHIAGALFYSLDYLWMEYSLSGTDTHLLDVNIDIDNYKEDISRPMTQVIAGLCKTCMEAVYVEDVATGILKLANHLSINIEQHLEYRIMFEEIKPLKWRY
jgi:hypothetical protein